MRKITQNHMLPIVGMLFGILTFCFVYGIRIIDPTYDDWLFAGGDLTQHYMGWLYYRQTDWTFPIGLLEGVSSTGQLSCMYLDCIPLLALLFKPFSALLPATFQYLGIWGVCSFGLTGFFAVLLLEKCSRNPLFCLAGSFCFVLSPPLLDRIYHHEALAGHWVILAGMCLWAYQHRKWKHWWTPSVLWAVLAAIAVLVQMYFAPMVFLLMCGALLHDVLLTKKWRYALCSVASATASVLLTLFCLGAFVGEGSYAGGGLGKFSSNLNTLFNPKSLSKFLKPMNILDGQGEGYGFLGFGILLGCVLSIGVLCAWAEKTGFVGVRKHLREKRPLLIGVGVTALLTGILAVSPKVTLNANVLFTIPYPAFITNLLSIFRSGGRFIWVLDYLIYFGVFYLLSRMQPKKTALCLTVFCCGMQIFDLRDTLRSKHEKYADTIVYESPLKDAAWEALADGAEEILFLPLPKNFIGYRELYMSMGYFAYHHHMRMSSFYIARSDYDSMAAYAQQAYEALCAGEVREDVLYVFLNAGDAPQETEALTVCTLDGITVARAKKSI